MWSIFKSRADGGFNPCFFQICSSDRIVSPRTSGLGTWKKQHRSPVIWLDSCLHIFSLHRTIFQILCHLHKKPRKSERFSGWGDAISLLLPARECNKKALPPTCDFELHRSGILMLQMMWEWYDCEPVALPLNMVFLLKAYWAVGVFFAEPVSSAMRSTLSKLATMSLDGCHRTKQSSLASPVMSFRDSWLNIAAHQLSLACYGMFYFRERGRLH